MKYADGLWLNKPGYGVNYATQMYEVTADEWNHTYPRSKAAFPLEWLHESKFWVNVARVDNAYGDRNLIPTLCACNL